MTSTMMMIIITMVMPLLAVPTVLQPNAPMTLS